MKKVILATLVPVLMAGSLPSQAAESATVNIKGSIVPTSCSLTVTGSVDYGELHSTEVGKADKTGYVLSEKLVPMAINCGAAIPVAISAQADDIASTASSIHLSNGNITEENKHRAGVLGINGDKPIGYYSINIEPDTSFSVAAGLVGVSNDSGKSWTSEFAHEYFIALDSSEWVGTGGKAIDNANFSLRVNATLDPNVAVSATDTIDFNTNTTVSLHYL